MKTVAILLVIWGAVLFALGVDTWVRQSDSVSVYHLGIGEKAASIYMPGAGFWMAVAGVLILANIAARGRKK